MTLAQAIEIYIDRKRAQGLLFQKGAAVLSYFCRDVGDVPLATITATMVSQNLADRHTSNNQRRFTHGLLFHFFEFWSLREAMPPLELSPAPAAVRSDFVPFIYTSEQLRTLMKATHLSQRRDDCQIDAETFRLLLLTLYATGAFLSEALDLRLVDLSLRNSHITIHGNRCVFARSIPICNDLQTELGAFTKLRLHKEPSDCRIFRTKAGQGISAGKANHNFRRLRKLSGIRRHDGAIYQPRLHDFRHTFAVHRITSWIEAGENLNRMLPALAAYMGNVGLESTEGYLAYTPERFRKELHKLSPQCGQQRWRDDPDLLEFLSRL